MNICFLIGKIVSEIDFRFILNIKNKENISISKFDLEIEENTILKVSAYDNIADYCYRDFDENDVVLIQGVLDTNEIGINSIEKV